MKTVRPCWPIVATIAGSDSGGGAGIQADLKTFFALKTHGVSVLTALTAQNPKKVSGVHPVPVSFVRKQLEAIWTELPPKAVKTGMLYSHEVVELVANFLKEARTQNVVVDPVMIATSGAALISPKAVTAYQKKLFPLAALITPNMDEARELVGRPLRTPEDLRLAGKELNQRFGCAVLIKGGHLKGVKEAIDFLISNGSELLLSAPLIRGVQTHGTGCTYAAAIASFLAHGKSLEESVVQAKKVISNAIAGSIGAGKHTVLTPKCP
jgi:hydroxymethylpyrimidine/phosphomethylpyrimidine kinase